MNKRAFKGTGIDIYNEKLSNGLEVYLIPFPKKKSYYICYGTKYGSNNFDFILDGKEVHVPWGVAHFLEHKMFAQESGPEPFEYFNKSGTYSNASTGYKSTIYYCSGTSNFENNLNYLLDFVNSPYFTSENVENEKDIIVQEVNMINDNPSWIMEQEMNKMIYNNHNYRVPIGGTEETVRKITKEDLYLVYNNFYHPNNMILLVAGNFDVEEVLKLIKNNKSLNNKKYQEIPKYIDPKESREVSCKNKVLELDNITNNKVCYGWKLKLSDFDCTPVELDVYLTILFNVLFGNTSIFREKLLNEGIFTSFSEDRKYDSEYVNINFWSETDDYERVINEVNDYFNNYEITSDEVERYKKVAISNNVFNSDDEASVVSNIFNDIVDFSYFDYDIVDFIKKITISDILNIKKKINIDNSSIMIVKSKE